jgi:hypothetical protein
VAAPAIGALAARDAAMPWSAVLAVATVLRRLAALSLCRRGGGAERPATGSPVVVADDATSAEAVQQASAQRLLARERFRRRGGRARRPLSVSRRFWRLRRAALPSAVVASRATAVVARRATVVRAVGDGGAVVKNDPARAFFSCNG